MSHARRAGRAWGAALAAAAAGCVTAAPTDADWAWQATELWQGDAHVQCVRLGDVDPESPGPEVVGVDDSGRVILVRDPAGTPAATVIHQHAAEVTGLHVADLDPDWPGPEIYAGCYVHHEVDGVVLQITVRGAAVHVRPVWEGPNLVHAMATLPGVGSAPAELLITNYSGQVAILTPTPGDGVWPARPLHQEPDTGNPEDLKIKDCAVGMVGGGTTRAVAIAVKSGRVVRLDADQPGVAQVLHQEPGGVSRMALAPDGSLWFGTNTGYIRHLHLVDGTWTATAVFHDLDADRGVVLGEFWTRAGPATVAIWGYSRCCRALVPHGDAWDSVTLFQDTDRGHWLVAAECIADNHSTELLCCGYSGRIVLLHRERRTATEIP